MRSLSTRGFTFCTVLLFITTCFHAANGVANSIGSSDLPSVIKVSTIEHAPYVIKDSSGNFSGFLIDMMDKVTSEIGTKYKIVIQADRFGILTKEGEWSGVVDDVLKGRTEVGLASLTMTKDRLNVVEFSIPILQNGITVVRGTPLPKSLSTDSPIFLILSPVSMGVCVCVLVILVVTIGLMTVNAAKNPQERAQRIVRRELGPNVTEEPLGIRDHISQSTWFVLSTAALQSGSQQPMSVAGRILALSWWLFIGIALCTYIMALVLTIVSKAGYRDRPFTTVEELMEDWKDRGGFKVYFQRGYMREQFKKNLLPFHQFIYAHSQVFDKKDVSKGQYGSLAWVKSMLKESDKNLIVMSSESTRNLIESMDCGSVMATEFFSDRYFGIIFQRKDTKLRIAINKALLKMADSGVTRTLINKWGLTSGGKCGLGFDTKDPLRSVRQTMLSETISDAVQGVAEMFHDSIPISMDNFAGVLVLYIIGLVLSLCGVAVDVYFYTHPEGFKSLALPGGEIHAIHSAPDYSSDTINRP